MSVPALESMRSPCAKSTSQKIAVVSNSNPEISSRKILLAVRTGFRISFRRRWFIPAPNRMRGTLADGRRFSSTIKLKGANVIRLKLYELTASNIIPSTAFRTSPDKVRARQSYPATPPALFSLRRGAPFGSRWQQGCKSLFSPPHLGLYLLMEPRVRILQRGFHHDYLALAHYQPLSSGIFNRVADLR